MNINLDSITFVIASYNDQDLIGQTIDSITRVTRSGDEIIVVDGASTDRSVDTATNALRNFTRSTVISETDSGIYDAWNKALKIGTGTWFAFLGCGDLIKPQYRNKMSQAIRQNPDANLIHTTAQFYLDGPILGNMIKMRKFGRALDKAEFRRKMRICHVGALHHSSLFEQSVFSTSYQCVSDYHFLLTHLEEIKSYFVDETLIDMEASGISMNSLFPIKEELKMKKELGGYNEYVLIWRCCWVSLKFYIFKLYNFKFKLF